jgi:hypothetical protein
LKRAKKDCESYTKAGLGARILASWVVKHSGLSFRYQPASKDYIGTFSYKLFAARIPLRRIFALPVMEMVMGHYQPETVSELASVTDDICKALQDSDGAPLNPEMKEALAKRVLELFENGVTNPDDLRIAIMADSLWASSRGVAGLNEVPLPSAAASVAPAPYK